jgi:HmuY protein
MLSMIGFKKCTVLGLAASLALALGGCSEDLAPEQPDAAIPDGDGGVVGPTKVKTTDNGDGTFTTSVNASSMADFVGFDFQSGKEQAPTGEVWDLSFRRFEIRLNGGSSGSAGGEVAILPLADFDTLKRAPAGGWTTDNANSTAINAGDGWYEYNPATHILEARDVVYVVRSAEGDYFKMKLTSYYDDAGSSGHPTFRWAKVDGPPANDNVVVDASNASAWTYVSVLGGVITVTNPQSSRAWDLAFSGAKIATNSGASGKGLGGARLAPANQTYEAITGATTFAYAVDGSGGNPVLADWYQGSPSTPKPNVYLVRTGSGAYAKLKITAWSNGKFTIRLASVARQVSVQSGTIDAQPAYFNLRQGQRVADASGDWDIAFVGGHIQSNSGTSGPGEGGAVDTSFVDMGSVVTAVGAQYAVDQELDGASQNVALSSWLGSNGSPRATVFLVRTADGGHVKLKFTSAAPIKFDWAYAGAGREDFPLPF